MDEELKKLLEENLRLTREIEAKVKSVNSKLVWTMAWGWIKFIVKIAILVAAIYFAMKYLPPLVEQLTNQFKQLQGGFQQFQQFMPQR
jgi:hypothetical protein